MLDSTTYEEANSDYVNWNSQRSRWYKGYIQTWLVHMRHPAHLVDELGWRGFVQFNTFVGGTPVLALLNLVFWAMTLAWFVGHFSFIKALYPDRGLLPGAVLLRVRQRRGLVPVPVGGAHLAQAVARVGHAHRSRVLADDERRRGKGVLAGRADRSFWEKTVHGLDENGAHDSAVQHSAGTSTPPAPVQAVPM